MAALPDAAAFRRTAKAAVFLPLLLMAALAAVLFWQVNRLLLTSHWVEHTSEVILRAQETEKLLAQRETGLRGYLLAGQPRFLLPYEQARQPLRSCLAQLRRLVSDNPRQSARLREIEAAVRGWDAYAERLRSLHDSARDYSALMATGEGVSRMDAVRDRFSAFVATEERLQSRRSDAVRHATGAMLGLLGILSLLAGTLLALAGRRQLATVSNSYSAALDEARESEQRFEAFMDHTPALAVIRDQTGRLVYGNAIYQRFLGPRAEAARGQTVAAYLPDDVAAPLLQADRTVLERDEPLQLTIELPGPDGKAREWLVHKFPLPLRDGQRSVGTIALDTTDQALLEAQLRQAQKMEAIGTLAGGVAHDFNNLLVVINGYSDLLQTNRSLDDDARGQLGEIRKAGDRAAALTRQLLAFSRQQVLAPRVLDLNDVVAGTERLLARLIGEDIEVATVLTPGAGRVAADAGQIEQVILNLAINARDAMPRGGKLTLETAAVELDESYTRYHAGVEPGPYSLLAVSDTGCGMSPEVLAHAFEPFFTTKEAGHGTGLGLATVHGIVKQSGGHVWVYSEPGRGTTFKIYLPRVEAVPAAAPTPVPRSAGGDETVLLVEDDAQVRGMVREILFQRGYRVLAAADAGEAQRLSAEEGGPIPLLLTDVVLTGGSGRDLAARLQVERPELRVLYMSGYTNDVAVRHGVLEGEMAFIQKPFVPETLARRVRELLDLPPPSERSPSSEG